MQCPAWCDMRGPWSEDGTDAKVRCMARLADLTAMLRSEDFVSQTIAAFKWADTDSSGDLNVYEFCPPARQCILRWLSEDVSDVQLHDAFLAFNDGACGGGDKHKHKLGAAGFVRFLQYCAVRTVRQSIRLILDGKAMTAGAEGSAADAAFQALVEFVTTLEHPEAGRG